MSCSAPAFTETFSDVSRWTPLPGITLEIASAPDRRGHGLHFHGRQEQAWNYASTSPFPLQAETKYRLTAWLRLADGFNGNPPVLLVQLLGAGAAGQPDGGKPHGQVVTSPYEPIRGGWQPLSGEFETPAGTAFGELAIYKGVQDPVEIDGWLADVRVVPIAVFTPAAYPFEKLPAPLVAVKGIHPRLYRTRAGFEKLRRQVGREPYRALLRQLREVADRAVRTGPASPAERDGSGDEQLWQRPVGDQLPNLAMAYRLTGERQYLETATAFIRASAGYPTWGSGVYSGWDLAAAHQLYGMALAYDWLYDDLDADTRARSCLEQRGRFMFEEVVHRPYRQRSYLQNHLWVNMTGLAAAGLALYGDEPAVAGVEGWFHLPLDNYRTVMAALGPDGASHEGVPYWSYGLEYLLKFMDLARSLLGVDLFAGNEWFRHTASFRVSAMLPRQSWRQDSTLLTFADGPRLDWYGPDYLLRKLAAEYRDGTAQWLADELARAQLCGSQGQARFLNLLWFDPTVTNRPPAALPTFNLFSDLGLVCMRSGWDGGESVLAFKCGPALGHQATRRFGYDPGAGHAHPDAGSLQLFAHGEWLLVSPGYCFKQTAYENTLLVDGHGQTGEGKSMFDVKPQLAQKLFPAIVRAAPGPEFDLLSARVAPAYDARLGLRRFDRHVVWFRPDCWIVIDAVESAAPATFSLLFHTDTSFAPGSGPSRAVAVPSTNANLVVTALWPPATNAVFITALQAQAGTNAPAIEPLVEETRAGLRLTLRSPAGAKCYQLDLAADPAGDGVIRALPRGGEN